MLKKGLYLLLVMVSLHAAEYEKVIADRLHLAKKLNDKKLLEIEFETGLSPLQVAATLPDNAYFHRLVETGVDLTKIDFNAKINGKTLLDLAINKKTIELLLERGAQVGDCSENPLQSIFSHYRKHQLNVSNEIWLSELLACWRLFITHGADVNKEWNKNGKGYHPIYAIITDEHTTREKKKDLIRFLIFNKADMSRRLDSKDDRSLLDCYKQSKANSDKSWYQFLINGSGEIKSDSESESESESESGSESGSESE